MQERRREERTPIIHSVVVEDVDERATMGRLVDISPKGLRIRGQEPVPVDEEVRLRLRLPERILGKKTIGVTAVCVWSRPDGASGEWSSGFEFYRVSQEDAGLILGLVLEMREAS